MTKHRKNWRHVYETRLPMIDVDWDDIEQIEKVKDVLYYKGISVPTTTALVRNALRFYCGWMLNKYEQTQQDIKHNEQQEEVTNDEENFDTG